MRRPINIIGPIHSKKSIELMGHFIGVIGTVIHILTENIFIIMMSPDRTFNPHALHSYPLNNRRTRGAWYAYIYDAQCAKQTYYNNARDI
jgi:hypothetical protein